MAKTCPHCGCSDIGPFSDNCPICAEPVRNVRSDAARASTGRNLPSVLWWILGGLGAAVLGVAGCCGVGMWRMGTAFRDFEKTMEQQMAQEEANRRARTVVVAAEPLLEEFQKDPAAADHKYRGKYLEISGTVERVARKPDDSFFIILHAGDSNAEVKIECFFDIPDDDEETQLRRLAKGQMITLRGEYDGRVTNIQVRDCILMK